MKIPLYVRAAKDWNARNGAYRVEGSKTYRPEALTDGSGNPLTTVHLKINLEIPDELLRPSPPAEVDIVATPADVGWTRLVEIELPPAPTTTEEAPK